MTTIYITRHGETEWNKQYRFQGNMNSELTEKGISAAEMLSERIENIDLDYIIASPLKRAYHTAEIVRGKKNVEIIKNEGFGEINLGDFEGLTYDEIKICCGNKLQEIEVNPFDTPYPNGENLTAFYDRVKDAFIDVIEKYKGKRILIVAHGGTIKCIECYFRKVKIDKNWMKNVVENCSLTCVEVDENDDIKEIYYNNTDHLSGEVAYN